MDRYKPLKAVDITPMTEEKYGYALDICIALLGPERMAGILLPQDIQLLRTQLIATLAPSTANHYLATLPASWSGVKRTVTAAKACQPHAHDLR
jgi:integrase